MFNTTLKFSLFSAKHLHFMGGHYFIRAYFNYKIFGKKVWFQCKSL